MIEKIEEIKKEIESFNSEKAEEIEQFRIRMLGRKGLITNLFKDFKQVPPEQKKETGKLLNELKTLAQEKVETLNQRAASREKEDSEEHKPDLTMPANFLEPGSRHPISTVRNQINNIFSRLGYVISEGPEIEDDWHNFTALNFPENHPARDMQDTFFIEKDPDIALRTHTSSVQVRVMKNTKPPIRTISPGRVFRNEAISARAHCIFHQVEGLYVDENVSFADLKQTLYYFAQDMFGPGTKIRLRPSFFPFTEPSAEMDVSCNICNEKGCPICKYSGWIEMLGCGMVDPNVLDNCNIDSNKYSGFAFGMGIERIVLNKYHINDLRLFFENDVRFLKQFEAVL